MQKFLESDPVGSQLQSEYRLKVLTLSVDRGYGEPQVVFELTAPDGDAPSTQVALLTCPSADLGLPLRLSEQTLSETELRLPPDIASALTSALTATEPREEALWLKFATPVGLLPMMPWERLIRNVSSISVLRLPYHRVSPAVRTRNLDCVVCLSSPTTVDAVATKAFIGGFVASVPADLLEHVRLHLFGDLNVQPELQNLSERFGDAYEIRVYEPPDTIHRTRGTRSLPGATRLESPWLIWIRDALRGRKVDVVHFLAHCDTSEEEGALVLAKSPARSDERWTAGYVGAAELVEFLNRTGAWSVAFTSPPDNPSMVGLRLLQDSIARLRPGPCLLHDMADPLPDDALGQAYRFLFNPEWSSPAASSSVSVYCHPWHAVRGATGDRVSEEIIGEVARLSSIAAIRAPGDESGWLASTQRVLEQSATELCDASSEQDAALEGRRDALQFVADRIAKYAQATFESADEGHEPPHETHKEHES